jgi:uncharacterized membrane protein YgdD (TMEM256/DUF423 family)
MQLIRNIRVTAWTAAILTALWVALTALSAGSVDSSWDERELLQWAADPDIFTTANYAEMLLVTTSVVVLFALLAVYFRERFPATVLIGLLFLPVYAGLQYASYGLQLSVVPSLARKALEEPDSAALALQLLQIRSDTVVGFLNGLGYAILAVPSMLYGRLLELDRKRRAGILLFANGVLCLIGLIGYILDLTVLSLATPAGGVLFLLSLIAIAAAFRSPKEGEA